MKALRAGVLGCLAAASLLLASGLMGQPRAALTLRGHVYLADAQAGGYGGTSVSAAGDFGDVPAALGVIGTLVLLGAAVRLRRRLGGVLLLAVAGAAAAALQTSSDGSGAYTLSPDTGIAFEPGLYRIGYTHDGYIPATRLLRLTGGEPASVTLADVTLQPLLPPCTVFPADNPWNTDISSPAQYPRHPNSDAYVNLINQGRDNLHPDFGTFYEGGPIGIPYVIVPGNQPKLNVTFDYAGESDAGPYPIPPDPPIEGGPDGDGDRHILMVDLDSCKLYELFYAFPPGHPDNPAPSGWWAGSGAVFDLRSNALRPDTWTSADAAGLPIYAGLVRYDEVVEQGVINHALRVTVRQTQRGFIHPATHYASDSTAPNRAPMGLRFRMKPGYNCSSYSQEAQVVCAALKKYGMFVADNGSDWFISGAHDPRWDDDRLGDIKRIPGDAFEAVYTGPILSPD